MTDRNIDRYWLYGISGDQLHLLRESKPSMPERTNHSNALLFYLDTTIHVAVRQYLVVDPSGDATLFTGHVRPDGSVYYATPVVSDEPGVAVSADRLLELNAGRTLA